MAWATAVVELRKVLSDGPTDKRTVSKKVLGVVNGTNKRFITFDYRRITNFQTGSTFPFGIYIDGVLQTVVADDPESGVFELQTAPAINKSVEGTYYSQWFTDSQLTQFLTDSALFTRAANIDGIPDGLKHAALKYASSEAYQFLSLFWARQTSEAFKLNDATEKDRFNLIKSYADMSKTLREEATVIRDDFYERGGQQKQPLWGFANVK